MKVRKCGLAWSVILGGMLVAPLLASAQNQVYMRVTSSKQGIIQGASTEFRHREWIELEQVTRAGNAPAASPRPGPTKILQEPPSTKWPTGAVQKGPRQVPAPPSPPPQRPPEFLTILKQADIASGRLLQESRLGTPSEAVIEFYVSDATVGNRLQQRLTLLGAKITSFSQRYQGGKYTEEFKLTYDRIQQEDFDEKGGRTVTSWDFRANRAF